MKVDITFNELVDRLRSVQSKLTDQNEHSDALFVGFAIQFLESSQQVTFKPNSILQNFVAGGVGEISPFAGGVTVVK